MPRRSPMFSAEDSPLHGLPSFSLDHSSKERTKSSHAKQERSKTAPQVTSFPPSSPLAPSSSSSSLLPLEGSNSGGVDGKRTMTWFMLAVWVYLCVNGGPYGIEAAVAASSPLVFMMAMIVIPFCWCFPISMISSELSAALPDSTGGIVDWTLKTFGSTFACFIGLLYIITNFMDNSLYPQLISSYVVTEIGVDPDANPWVVKAVSWVVICLSCVINSMGLEEAGTTAAVLTIIILAPVLVLVMWCTPYVNPADWVSNKGNTDWSVMMSLALWVFSGWEDLGNLAEKVQDPQRSFPKAMVTTLLFMCITTLIPVYFAISVQPDTSTWTDSNFQNIGLLAGGQWLSTFVSIGATVGLFCNLMAQHLVSSHALHFIANKGWMPSVFAYTYGDQETPVVSIFSCGLVICVLQFAPFDVMSQIWNISYCLVILTVLACFLRLRLLYPVHETDLLEAEGEGSAEEEASSGMDASKSTGTSVPLDARQKESRASSLGTPLLGASGTVTAAAAVAPLPVHHPKKSRMSLSGGGGSNLQDLTEESADEASADDGAVPTEGKRFRRPFLAAKSMCGAVLLCIPPIVVVGANAYFFISGQSGGK